MTQNQYLSIYKNGTFVPINGSLNVTKSQDGQLVIFARLVDYQCLANGKWNDKWQIDR